MCKGEFQHSKNAIGREIIQTARSSRGNHGKALGAGALFSSVHELRTTWTCSPFLWLQLCEHTGCANNKEGGRTCSPFLWLQFCEHTGCENKEGGHGLPSYGYNNSVSTQVVRTTKKVDMLKLFRRFICNMNTCEDYNLSILRNKRKEKQKLLLVLHA